MKKQQAIEIIKSFKLSGVQYINEVPENSEEIAIYGENITVFEPIMSYATSDFTRIVVTDYFVIIYAKSYALGEFVHNSVFFNLIACSDSNSKELLNVLSKFIVGIKEIAQSIEYNFN